MSLSFKENRDSLIIEHSTFHKILTLGLYIKKVTIDKEHQMIIIDQRIAWAFNRNSVLYFEEMDHIDFSHSSRVRRNYSNNSHRRYRGRRVEVRYEVCVVDKNHQEHNLFTLSDSGRQGVMDSMIGSDSTSYVSGIGDEARHMVGLVESYTGLTIGKV